MGWRVSKIRKLDLGDLIQQSDPPHLRTFGSAEKTPGHFEATSGATIVREIEGELVKTADPEMLGNWSYKSNRILVAPKIGL